MQQLDKEELLASLWALIDKKVGYVSIIGRPNSWKSTFLNSLIWEKVSIVSSVPQTTRRKVLGIYNDKESQIIFIDTPWIHKENKTFNEIINKEAIWTLNSANAVLYFIDTSRDSGEEEEYIKEILSMVKTPVITVYTKTDMDPVIEIPEGSVRISSFQKKWFKFVLNAVKKHLEFGPILYPEEYYTTSEVDFRISEIIREKVFLFTKEEIPHSSFVKVEEYEDNWTLLKMVAYIYVESDSQKKILIWKWWALVTKIWKESRLELEKLYWKKVFLALRVKTLEKWRKKEHVFRGMFK